ncbi:MAG: tRNA (cytidine(34)-2'-O)-methyltransferase [Mariprofundales bacterium]|nr:tRNA (cytidine(34)-2'-O)-methyltransferase [Mariprofundales bacterium]
MESPLHIVLFEPEIPPNTGSIARMCACTGCQLHLVHPLGFTLDDRQLRRAGLDYWQFLSVDEYQNWADLRQTLTGDRHWFGLSTRGNEGIWQARFAAGDVLVMGPETRGLPAFIREEIALLRIPLRSDAPVRSLNLAAACAVVTYEALRQLDWQGGE